MARRVIPSSASITTVCNPARAVKVAALAPAGPPPTMATSYIRLALPGDDAPHVANTRRSQVLPVGCADETEGWPKRQQDRARHQHKSPAKTDRQAALQ